MHLKLTVLYYKVSLEQVAALAAPMPFGQRLLVPLLVHLSSYFLPVEVDKLFFLMEWLFVSLLYFTMLKLLQYEFSLRQSQVLSWLFLLLLPLNTVINYRFSSTGLATFFFSYDTPSLFFLALGFLLCLRSKWFYFIPLIFIATINRETSLLLVLMIPALHWKNLHGVYKQMVCALIVYLLARWLVLSFLHDTEGSLLEWYFRGADHTHFEVNLYWLLNEQNLLLFMFCFAGLPLFWFAFYDYIPLLFRPLRYIALLYFIALLAIGNFPEARLFSEIILLLYLPVCIALKRWICDLEPTTTEPSTGLIYYIDRYSVLATLFVCVVFRNPINQWVIWLSHL
jgi:hypothetical protein